jgi:uncharacterized membrane protein YdbT with pleckstrin-like domain
MNTMTMNGSLMSIKPSQWLNFGYALSTVVGLLIHPILGGIVGLYLLWKVLEVYFLRWDITNDSIIEREGVLNVTMDEIHLFRIKDVHLYQPLLYRIVGISKLCLVTSDKTRPILVLNGIKDGNRKREMFKKLTLSSRKSQGVREFDFR